MEGRATGRAVTQGRMGCWQERAVCCGDTVHTDAHPQVGFGLPLKGSGRGEDLAELCHNTKKGVLSTQAGTDGGAEVPS